MWRRRDLLEAGSWCYFSQQLTASVGLNVNAELVIGNNFAKRLDDERRDMKTLIETLDLKAQ
jgi:hypothetical protein